MKDWEWYDHIPTKVLFLHLLLSAHYKDLNWRGIELKRGDVLTSYRKLAKETTLSLKQVRTATRYLSDTGEIVIKTARAGAQVYSVISICEYASYQSDEEVKGTQKGTPRAHEGHTGGTAIIEEGEEGEEIKNPPKSPQGDESLILKYPTLDTPEFHRAWADKMQHRKERRDKPLTAIGKKRMFKEFAEWGVVASIQALEESIRQNWTGVFFPKGPRTNGKPVILKQELAEPIGWRECLTQLKEFNPGDRHLFQSNPDWDWEDQPKAVQKLINKQLKRENESTAQ